MNSGYYTLGPAVAANRGYTAGHGISGSTLVYLVDSATGTSGVLIGSAKGHYGGAEKDWALISASVTLKPIVKLTPSVAGTPVYM